MSAAALVPRLPYLTKITAVPGFPQGNDTPEWLTEMALFWQLDPDWADMVPRGQENWPQEALEYQNCIDGA